MLIRLVGPHLYFLSGLLNILKSRMICYLPFRGDTHMFLVISLVLQNYENLILNFSLTELLQD